MPDWPDLGWVARISPSTRAGVFCGAGVEEVDGGILAAAWSGDFQNSSPLYAPASIGTGLLPERDGWTAFCGNAGSDVVFVYRGGGDILVSNTIPGFLSIARDGLRPGYPFYNQDLFSYLIGGNRYRFKIPTRLGWFTPYYRAVSLRDAGDSRPIDHDICRTYDDFAEYRDHVRELLAALFVNATSPVRRIRYRPIASVSSGYDSAAGAVIARDAGCDEAFTFREASFAEAGTLDTGEHIARMLGLQVHVQETLAYRWRDDLPETEFIAAGYGGPQVYLANSAPLLRERLIVSGFAGDLIWDRDLGIAQEPTRPLYAGGFSGALFNLRLPALAVALPMLGAGDAAAIGRLSRHSNMQEFSVGGDYDRPLPRRILEEAGIPRDAFATRKLMVTPGYDTLGHRRMPINEYLGPESEAQFESWLTATGGFPERYAKLRNKVTRPIGRWIWSNRLIRWARTLGYPWPPTPAAFWHFRTSIRKNAYLFHWAVEREMDRYRTRPGNPTKVLATQETL